MSHPTGASYVALLRSPGARGAFAAATVVRLNYATLSLALLLTVQRATGSFAVAGTALGVCALPSVLAPYKSRLIDRHGVPRVLLPLGAGYAVTLLVLALLAAADVTRAAPYLVLSGLAGALTPPVGPIMRGIWATLTPDPADRNRAYSLDTVAEESLFAAGPLLVGAIVLVAEPAAALVLTAGLAALGCAGLARSPLVQSGPVAQRSPVAPPAALTRQRLLGPLLLPEVRWVLVAMLGVGFALAPMEIAVAATATESGHPAAAGSLLAILSVASAAGGLLWGRLRHRHRHSSQLLALLAVLATGTAAAGFATSLPTLALTLALIGLCVAPTFVVAYVLADELVDAHVRTETSTWVATASNLGGAAGAVTAGLLVEHASARAAFLLGGLTLAGLTLILTVRRPGRHRDPLRFEARESTAAEPACGR